ncbi:MAG: penicillin acylase family protein, partial [Bacteroidota bacterium]
MRLIKFLTALLLTAAFCYALNRSFPGSQSAIPALGQLFCPFTGFWQNAEGKSSLSDRQFNFPELSAPVKVYFDQRKVPHIFADNLKDAVCVQGYVTARDRLFQMDLSTRAAAGRLSEMLGARTLEFDKRQRRIGMVMAAENTLKNWEKNPDDLELIQSYVKGINTYISSLSPRDYPVEYKLLDFSPELWTPMRCALLMKNMDLTLCAREEDLETTNVLQALGRETFDYLYPLFNPKTSPIIPADREWDFEPLNVYNDSLSKPMFGEYRHRVLDEVPDNIGSNNWAVDGSKTASGNPILCNDPHLRLTLPSIWYEVQFHLAESNFYGVSLPGFPGVVIGFNKDIAWGMTNAALDLLDWYKIQWQDDQKSKYLYDGQVKEVLYKIEPYKVKGQADVMDTVRYTVWGPIAYDDPESSHYDLAIRWLPHQAGGSAIQTFKGLSKATNYDQYRSSLNNFRTPPQNIVFASKEGEIALTIQGQFPMRRPEQGRFVLDGSTSESAWKGTIPIKHNPSIRNPESGFVSSANQRSTGPSYPYNY